MLFSQIITPYFLPESKSLFFTSVSHLLPCIQDGHYCLSKFHIYALIYCFGVSLSDLLLSVQQAPVLSTSLKQTQKHFFFQLSKIPLFLGTTTSLPIRLLQTSRLLLYPSCCKQCFNEHWHTCVSLNSSFFAVYEQQWDCQVVWQLYFQFRFFFNFKIFNCYMRSQT